MLSRGALGLVPGNQVQRAIYLHNRPSAKKPCRSVSGNASLPARGLRFLSAKKLPEIQPAKLDPLYLFYCGVDWHRSAQTESGWELVQAMLSEDRGRVLSPKARRHAAPLCSVPAKSHCPRLRKKAKSWC